MKNTDTPLIERLKELLAKATPGLWGLTSDAGHPTNARITSTARRHIAKVYANNAGQDPVCDANATLIVETINALPHLIATLGTLTPSAGEGVEPWIVWSNEHRAFWAPNRRGYTGVIEKAGRYTRAEAEAICRGAQPRANSTINVGTPPEICMPAPEAALTPSPPLEQPDIEGRARELAEVARFLRLTSDVWTKGGKIDLKLEPIVCNRHADTLERIAGSLPTTEIRREAWQPIETAPKDFTWFLAFGHWRPSFRDPEPRMGVMRRRDAQTYCPDINGDATHWMPLPAQPGASNDPRPSPPSRPSFDKWDYARAVLKDSEGCGE